MRDLVGRTSRDMIIGFFFEGKDLERIIQRETQLAAERLGGPVVYGGRPLGRAHQRMGINLGHLRRRLAILRAVLKDHGVSDELAERWLAHERGLEGEITNQRECVE